MPLRSHIIRYLSLLSTLIGIVVERVQFAPISTETGCIMQSPVSVIPDTIDIMKETHQ